MKALPLLIVLFANVISTAQSKYGVNPESLPQYQASIKSNPEKELVDLEKFIPGIILDIRYATTNNFTKEKIYNLAKAYARKPVAVALKKAQEDFKKLGTVLKFMMPTAPILPP